jgi:arabinan endo-1,5-alpha-L-arabinosidase
MAVPAFGTQIPIHDPSLIVSEGRFYLFGTGRGIVVWSSPDHEHWTREAPVFSASPEWTHAVVPKFDGHYWAPDINHVGDRFYLYYAVSAFGRNTSAIGLATNETLDPHSPRFKWVDEGKVVQSIPGRTNWNAIDPNLAFDGQTPYLAFGSFWSGLKLTRLQSDLRTPASPLTQFVDLASRLAVGPVNPPAPAGEPVDAGGNAIEAPFIFRRAGRFYLFASIDYCCRGPRSTYKIIVGRAEQIAGPYVGRSGIDLRSGGGTVLQGRSSRWYGVGHNCVVSWGGADYVVAHGYDVRDGGRSKLLIEAIHWTADGWPEIRPEE